jgi:hypothetical protein
VDTACLPQRFDAAHFRHFDVEVRSGSIGIIKPEPVATVTTSIDGRRQRIDQPADERRVVDVRTQPFSFACVPGRRRCAGRVFRGLLDCRPRRVNGKRMPRPPAR